jgi:hypothetical protein
MTAMSQFRAGDSVVVEARGDFYAYCDGWRGRVAAVGPKDPNPCHSQIPGGYVLVEVASDEAVKQLLVPFNELRLAD